MKKGTGWWLLSIIMLAFTACEPRAPIDSKESEALASSASDSNHAPPATTENNNSTTPPGGQRVPGVSSKPSGGEGAREPQRFQYGSIESSLIAKEGGLNSRVEDTLTSDKFDDFLTALERENAHNSDATSRRSIYREALEQTLSEIPGTSAPVRFTCASNICAGYVLSEASADWFNDWQARLMQGQLAPISTMAVKNVDLKNGSIQHRFVFTTAGPGRIKVRRGR